MSSITKEKSAFWSFIFLISILFSFQASAQVQFQNGDIIFQTSLSNQANAIMLATGSRLSHVGLIEVSPRGEVYVVEAIARVSRTPLQSWIQRGKGGRYEVYRHPRLGRQALGVVQSAKSYIGRGYDIYFSSDNTEIYCSELVALAFQSAGISVGRWQKIGSLNINHSKVKKLAQARWKGHPRCRGVKSFEACWPLILNSELISPASQAADSKLMQVFSNY